MTPARSTPVPRCCRDEPLGQKISLESALKPDTYYYRINHLVIVDRRGCLELKHGTLELKHVLVNFVKPDGFLRALNW